MVFTPESIVLRNNKDARLVPAPDASPSSYMQYQQAVYSETPYTGTAPQEAVQTVQAATELLYGLASSTSCLPIFCVYDGIIIGEAFVSLHQRYMARHRATISVSVLRQYWGIGVGTALLHKACTTALSMPDITQLELDVVTGNVRAIQLYMKYGFQIVGTLPNHHKLANGAMYDSFLMILEGGSHA